MARYALVDVQNTATTTHKMLGFVVDWHKFCQYLHNERGFERIFLYSGIQEGDRSTAREFSAIAALPFCVVRSKVVRAYKRKDQIVPFTCPNCQESHAVVVDMGYERKANCDVELAVDALSLAGPQSEVFIFSGDGDFEFVIKKIMDSGAFICIVSHAEVQHRSGMIYGRYSTKLRALVKLHPNQIRFEEIKNLKFKIQKDL